MLLLLLLLLLMMIMTRMILLLRLLPTVAFGVGAGVDGSSLDHHRRRSG